MSTKKFTDDENGQILIIMALLISVLLAGLSLLYTQNLLAGTESALTQLNFPKNEIRDLNRIVEEQLVYYAINNPENFLTYVRELDKQITMMYALHGAYADIDVYDVKTNINGDITSFSVKIIFSNAVVDYEHTRQIVI
jgi:hypothetical protein